MAVPAEPAVIFNAPTHTKICPRAAAGEYSLRAARVAAKKVRVSDPRCGISGDREGGIWEEQHCYECGSDNESESGHEVVGVTAERADHDTDRSCEAPDAVGGGECGSSSRGLPETGRR